GGFHIMATPKPINHSARSVGQSPADPHGVPLSTRNRSGRPRLEKTRRNAAWTAAGSTRFQRPWGENRGLQDRAAALVHQAEPTYPLAAAQANPFRRVHLPNLMRPTSPALLAGGAAPGRRRGQAGLLKPALQGPFAGTSPPFLLHQHADQTGAPTGMLLP